jgi:hypothetical protein
VLEGLYRKLRLIRRVEEEIARLDPFNKIRGSEWVASWRGIVEDRSTSSEVS